MSELLEFLTMGFCGSVVMMDEEQRGLEAGGIMADDSQGYEKVGAEIFFPV